MNDHHTRSSDLLALNPLQRKILIQLTRDGPTDAIALTQSRDHDQAALTQALHELLAQGQVYPNAAGQFEVALGKTRRRTLPARLWPALTASSRLYSAQEIATLRTVVPILQFARAKLSEFADHGPNHALRVKSFATQLGYILDLTSTEQHLLRAAALFHDVGNIVDRTRHHIISQESVERLTAAGELPFSVREAALIGLICRWHRKEYDPTQCDELSDGLIRTGLLASILRVADAMDIDERRSDYTARFVDVLKFFYPDEMPYWTSLEEILGVRICCTPDVALQIFTHSHVTHNLQIAMLRKDLASTPLDWSVQQLSVAAHQDAALPSQSQAERTALLAFPFEPHSLIMAALSRQQLQRTGYRVELLGYPDSATGPAWLWQQALPTRPPAAFAQLVVLNDRPDATLNPQIFTTIQRWQDAGVTVSLLNRHEANWLRLPTLIQQGVSVTLGGDWAYFWGTVLNQDELTWARLAALCTRDPTQSTLGISGADVAVTHGLLKVVYDTALTAPDSNTDWAALAAPILDRIAHNDRAYFAAQAAAFTTSYATMSTPAQVVGRVLLFDGLTLDAASDANPSVTPQTYLWALEAAIEAQGRQPERGICYKTPYAIATWPAGDAVELLAINHWREESAIPIRLLYPAELGPPAQGNECIIHVRLRAAQLGQVVQALIAACNQREM